MSGAAGDNRVRVRVRVRSSRGLGFEQFEADACVMP